jgi:enoyl-CoA hydratase/carnithine racemase
MDNDLVTTSSDGLLRVTFNRPNQRNAMTWEMYTALFEACEEADRNNSVRGMVLRGAGGEAFVAGTDIRQFQGFTGADGVEYEKNISKILDRLQEVNVPVIAVIDGFCIGGGLGIAAAADIRICDETARFGIPIARTLGNCLSIRTLASLTRLTGQSLATELLMTGRLMGAAEAHQGGLVTTVADDIETDSERLIAQVLNNAPLTIWATKEMFRRLNRMSCVNDEDIVSRVYGSEDFANAVESFLAKEKPTWHGK